MLIWKEFTFEAAHWLPAVPAGHKCHGMHGHSYRVRVEVRGRVGQQTGWVIDYADIAAAWEQLARALDHHVLNEIPGLENSTCEHLCRWVWDRLAIAGLYAVEIRETPTAGARYEGE